MVVSSVQLTPKGFACLTTGQMNRLNEIAIQAGLPVNLAFIKYENGEYKSPLWRFFTDAEKQALISRLNVEEGDIVFFVAGYGKAPAPFLVVCALKWLTWGLTKGTDVLNFLWVVDFPLLGYSEEDAKWNAVHHPFIHSSERLRGDIPFWKQESMRRFSAIAYDVVLNGTELGGGSLRIHESDLQAKMFTVLGVSEEEQKDMFGRHILEAFQFGAPPHGDSCSWS